ncbi:hypothetical protein LJR225_005250 [Phenylobacterium sp. LjRoot225]
MMMFQTLQRVMSPADTLKMECGRCGHAAEWPQATALRRIGPDATPAEVRRRLRCGKCGAGDVKAWI